MVFKLLLPCLALARKPWHKEAFHQATDDSFGVFTPLFKVVKNRSQMLRMQADLG